MYSYQFNKAISQGEVLNVQPGFLGWFLTKTHPGMEQIA